MLNQKKPQTGRHSLDHSREARSCRPSRKFRKNWRRGQSSFHRQAKRAPTGGWEAPKPFLSWAHPDRPSGGMSFPLLAGLSCFDFRCLDSQDSFFGECMDFHELPRGYSLFRQNFHGPMKKDKSSCTLSNPSSWRPVIDLTHLTRFLAKEKFKMEKLHSIQQAIHRGNWLILIVLKDTYFHVSVAASSQSFLCFAVDHQHLQFTWLPFGLSTSPAVFSEVLLAVVALIRKKGKRLHHYLDYLLLLSQDKGLLVEHRDHVLEIL